MGIPLAAPSPVSGWTPTPARRSSAIILYRAAERTRIEVILVANRWLQTSSRFIRAMQVAGGPDVADDAIAERVAAGDLVVTQDIPLAARVLASGAAALDPRGVPFSPDSIAQRLSIRDFNGRTARRGRADRRPAQFLRTRATARRSPRALDQWLARQR